MSLSFCLSTVGRGHVIITHDSLDLIVQAPTPVSHPLLMSSADHNWRPVQTCSLEDPPALTSGGC